MKFSKENNNQISLVLYSSLFFILTEIILLRISTQFFFFFSHLPILFLCIILTQRQIINSVVLSAIILTLIKIFNIFEFINYKDLIFLSFVSIIALSFTFLNHLKKNENHMNGIIFSRLILILGFILSVFILFYYRNLDHSAMIESLSEILRKFNPKSLYYSADTFSEILTLIVNILPSVNFLVIISVFIVNFRLATMICKSLKFIQNYSFSFKNISLEKSYTYIFLFFIILKLLNFEGIEILSVNILIFLSSGYIAEGYQNLQTYFEKFEISSSIKFLIIFLLFIFLGYVLLLIIFLIGFYKNIKKLLFRI
tara:strand:+ start:571 stop:1506 length:936 start_codon:yes stop_codon:yes gene_type:complete